MTAKSPTKLALVLSGGGARGAYEAGIIHYIRTMLPKRQRERVFNIHCGASVGAINTCYLASTSNDLARQGKEAWNIWASLREEDIYRRDSRALIQFLFKSVTGLVTNLVKTPVGPSPTHFRGLLDTTPLLPYLERVVPWGQIPVNVASGLLDAVSVVATNVFTGRMELFIEKGPKVKYTGEYIHHLCRLSPLLAKASAAIPVVFPSVFIDGIAYTDGGLRLNTPMSPAIQLGADAIFVVGLHHYAKPGEKVPFHGKKGEAPSLGQILGRVMNSIFLDRIHYDMEQLERINRVIDWGEMLYGKTFLRDVNRMLERKEIRGDIANRGLKRLHVFRIKPSQDVGELFLSCFRRHRQKHMTLFEKTLVRVLDIDSTSGVDFLSYVVFMPEYIKALLSLGFEDAKAHHNQIKEFMDV